MATPSPDGPPSLGLRGWAAALANLSAVTLIGVMFYVQNGEFHAMAKEDRAMCREESRLQWAAVREGQASIAKLARSVEDLAEEVARLRSKQEGKGQPR